MCSLISTLYKIDKWLLFVVISVSLLFSVWANMADNILNNDGVEYLKSSRAILSGDWSAAVETYKWPFYSACIALVSQLSGLSLTLSAYVLNAFFFVWLAIAFVALVRLAGGNRSTLWFAVLVILAFPAMNKFRPYLIRDPAFLALFLSACYAFFLYVLEGQKRQNMIAIMFFLAATLFRLEGLIYLFLTQSYLFNQRLKDQPGRWFYFVLLALVAAMLLMFISWWQFSSTDELGYASIFIHPVAFMEAAWEQILQPFEKRLEVVGNHILVGYSESYSALVLLLSAFSLVLLKVIHSLYYLYFVLCLIAWRRGWLFPVPELYRPWRFLVLASFVILFIFVVANWFLTTRYALPMALLLLMAAPFVLDKGYQSLKGTAPRKWLLWLAILLIVLSGIKSLDLSTRKHYLKVAAEWISQNVPADASIYTNDRILGHYLERDVKVGYYWPDWEFFKAEAMFARRNQEYGAINLKHTDPDYIKNLPILLRRKLIAEFVNDKGTRVMIFDFRQGYDPDRLPVPVYVK